LKLNYIRRKMGCSSGKPSSNVTREENRKKLTKIMKKHRIDYNPTLDSNYVLKLMLDINKEGVHRMLNDTHGLKFDHLKKLFVFGMEFLTQDGLHD